MLIQIQMYESRFVKFNLYYVEVLFEKLYCGVLVFGNGF